MDIKFIKSDPTKPVIIPEYKTRGSAGMDLSSSSEEKIILSSFERKLIPTNLIMEIPSDYEGQVRPRSGLALKHGITVLNTPGTIDSDYRGEIKVLLINLGKEDFEINFGDRIAQLVISKHITANLISSTDINETERGDGGYGSTGIS
ncbi:MAG TPA: dUTP diphosphatase [Ignavibacteria bacterium]|nr:dUTP diphosphatase [Ignavibacteria bacterium]